MRISGQVHLAAPPARIWTLLTDPEQISHCTPGLRHWRVVEPNKRFQIALSWGGEQNPINIPIELEWTHLIPPHQMQMTGQGTMGSGLIKADGEFTLQPVTQETDLYFTAVFHTPNKIIDRIIANAFPRATDSFFQCIQQMI